jgi:small redox-active disulfide protein 2
MKVEVLGTGCANCKRAVQIVEDVAKANGLAIDLVKVEELPKIMAYGVMSTPAVVVDGKVVHAGGIPTKDKVAQWLAGGSQAAAAATGTARCCG